MAGQPSLAPQGMMEWWAEELWQAEQWRMWMRIEWLSMAKQMIELASQDLPQGWRM